MFESLLGNEHIKTYLHRAVEQNRLPHALIFSGLDGIGKRLFARELACRLLQTSPHRIETENHPDFHSIRPEGKSGLHSIESLRTLINDVHSAPFEAPCKVFIVYDAERMQPAAANALLKTLEEPNPDTTLILLTSSPREILPTILSRCIKLSFHPLKEQEIALFLQSRGHSERYAKLAQGSASRSLDLVEKKPLEELLFRLLAQRPSFPQLVDALEEIEEHIEDEDPARKNRNIEHFFAAYYMWHRDQHARKLGVKEENLFFPNEPAVSCPILSLEAVQKNLDEARLAVSRNIKISSCLRLFI